MGESPISRPVILPVAPDEGEVLWTMLQPVFQAGDTYAIDPDISRADALAYWTGASHGAFAVWDGDRLLGSYYIKRNQAGGGAHVCNCGFVTAPAARGHGIARLMLEDALMRAQEQGFRAMQFNFVVETNTRAIATWTQYGFDTVGRLAGAFHHPQKGYVDALVMYKSLV